MSNGWGSNTVFPVRTVNRYLACKQHLLSTLPPADVLQITRDIVALHATAPTGPYLSLWARVPGFRREMLDVAFYEQKTLARLLCMRDTLHVVPSDEVPLFLEAYRERVGRASRSDEQHLLTLAGLCQEDKASALLDELRHRILSALHERGPQTVRQIGQAVPELRAKVQHSAGKSYAGEFSVGSRLLPSLCAQGLLIRARPRGTWRSNQYEYASLSEWLPSVAMETAPPREARTWLVRHYLSAFGPVTFDDVQWWTGFSKSKVQEALGALDAELETVGVEGFGDQHLMLSGDVHALVSDALQKGQDVFLLPSLDPYIMGYRDRRRFLAEEYRAKVFDRVGNAVPTVWVNGRLVGAWGQRRDGKVVLGFFEQVGAQAQALLEEESQRLEVFLAGEFLHERFRTAFTRRL